MAIGLPIDSLPLLPPATASPEIFFPHPQVSCQCFVGKSTLSSACRWHFPCRSEQYSPCKWNVPFQGDWVIINLLVQELYNLCKPKMLKAGWKTRKIPLQLFSLNSAFIVSNSTIQRLSETSVLHEDMEHMSIMLSASQTSSSRETAV